MTDLAALLRRVILILEAADVPYMVVGGVANMQWGIQRVTTDVDVTIDVQAIGTAGVLALADKIGRPKYPDPALFVERARVLPLETDLGAVDLMIATLAFELEALDRTVAVDLEGVPVRVCRAEDLLVYKAVSERDRDFSDVVGILRRQRGRLDMRSLDAAIEEFATEYPDVADRWSRAKADAGI